MYNTLTLPEYIIYKKNDKLINILKKQGLATFENTNNNLYVIYSQLNYIKIGDIILKNESTINSNMSKITYMNSKGLFCSTLYPLENIYKANFYKKHKSNLSLNLIDFNIDFNNNIFGEYENIIINLKNNSGGKFKEMLQFAGYFFQEHENLLNLLELSTGRIIKIDNKEKKQFFAKQISIICDHTTYSSAEIFIHIMQEKHNVKIYGNTPGKRTIYKRIYENENLYIEQKKYELFKSL